MKMRTKLTLHWREDKILNVSHLSEDFKLVPFTYCTAGLDIMFGFTTSVFEPKAIVLLCNI